MIEGMRILVYETSSTFPTTFISEPPAWIDMAAGLTLMYGTAGAHGVDPYWAPILLAKCYRPFYGWTWASYEPWGWLPYHYGRW
jgi:hypothetical protein